MYRPTVRYDDVYKDYVNDLYHATTLDRNQLIRAALFVAALSKDYQELIRPYLRRDVPLPSASWGLIDHSLWLEQSPKIRGGGRDVNGGEKEIRRKEDVGRLEQTQGPVRQVRQGNGGIKITFG